MNSFPSDYNRVDLMKVLNYGVQPTLSEYGDYHVILHNSNPKL